MTTEQTSKELLALDPTGLDAAVRECARITAPEISDQEYERIKADNSPRYQNTRSDMERTLRAYLSTAQPSAAVTVKPLEWQKSHVLPWQDDWHTTGPFTYTIRCADENGWKWSSGYGYGWCSTPDAAKAAAQADYEQRILSAIAAIEVAPAKGDDDAGAMREALERLVSDIEDYQRVNNLAPSPGKTDCWQSVTIAKAALATQPAQPAPAQQAWSTHTHDEIIKRLMGQVGMPNSTSLYTAFKQFANELHALEANAKFKCLARKQSLPEPGECSWPDCGCDSHATKVIESLVEQGWTPAQQTVDVEAVKS